MTQAGQDEEDITRFKNQGGWRKYNFRVIRLIHIFCEASILLRRGECARRARGTRSTVAGDDQSSSWWMGASSSFLVSVSLTASRSTSTLCLPLRVMKVVKPSRERSPS